MKTSDHLLIGRYLNLQYLASKPDLYRKAFIIGGIFPDINVFSYFRGLLSTGRIRGHNYKNAENYIRRLSDKLSKSSEYSLFDYLRLGELLHYITDAFTFAHNERFDGDLKKHIEYEKRLHLIFNNFRERNIPFKHTFSVNGSSLFKCISVIHQNYISNANKLIWDIENICTAVHITMNMLVDSKNKGMVRRQRRAV